MDDIVSLHDERAEAVQAALTVAWEDAQSDGETKVVAICASETSPCSFPESGYGCPYCERIAVFPDGRARRVCLQ